MPKNCPELFSPASAEIRIPEGATLSDVRLLAKECRACPLWRHATQTVFGEGRKKAALMLVGEQPGDREDREGRPFVGPAGLLLDRALTEAGIDRDAAYVTNVVKHFKFEPRGKTRIHKKPNRTEIVACRPWLDIELAHVQPKALVCLGATAAQALLGRDFRITKQRGELVSSPLASYVMATLHPSAVLRAPDDETRQRQRGELVSDLRKVAKLIS
jgi:DNA polymerase